MIFGNVFNGFESVENKLKKLVDNEKKSDRMRGLLTRKLKGE